MVIMPSGKVYHDWSLGKDEKLTKVASAGKKVVATHDVRDSLYEAAAKYMASKKNTKKACGGLGGAFTDKSGIGEVEKVDGFGAGTETSGVEGFGGKDVVEVGVDSFEGSEGSSEVDTLKKLVDDMTVALDEAKAKLEGLSGASTDEVSVEIPEDTEGVDEVEIEIGDDKDGEVEIEVEDDKDGEVEIEVEDDKDGEGEAEEVSFEFGKDDEVPGVDEEKEEEKGESEEGINKKSEECCDAKKDKKKTEKSAKTIGDFQKFSAISPATRKAIYDYYVNDLGYPKDYCKLLVTDFEKK